MKKGSDSKQRKVPPSADHLSALWSLQSVVNGRSGGFAWLPGVSPASRVAAGRTLLARYAARNLYPFQRAAQRAPRRSFSGGGSGATGPRERGRGGLSRRSRV